MECISNENDERLSQLVLKNCLLLANVFEKLRKISLTVMGYSLVIIWAHQL